MKKDTPPFTAKGEYLFRVIKTIQSAGNHNENCIAWVADGLTQTRPFYAGEGLTFVFRLSFLTTDGGQGMFRDSS